jgi:predicted metal-dependent phosphoesterase TrpH
MVRADLHIHTKYSPDASTNPKTVVDRLNAHPTIKAAAITDHNTLEGFIKTKELAKAYSDITIIPGVEITALEGEIIVLGAEELPPKPWAVQSIIDFARKRGVLVVAPHPYRGYGLGALAKAYHIDAIETLNAITSPEANKAAENLAKEMSLPGVAGSDAHEPDELWSVYTEIQASLDVDAILKAIKNGFVRVSHTEKSIRF